MTISKLENQQILADKKRFSPDEQIRQTLVQLEPLWAPKGLALDLDLDQARMAGDEELLAQVWRNLISNAIRFSHPGGTLTVRLTDSPTRVTVRVIDQGIGMSDEVQRHIFEKFYQADHSRTGQGNGLGLTLTKRIIDLSGGTVQVKSAPGKGAQFTVTLPK